jgi:hypothetical protein
MKNKEVRNYGTFQNGAKLRKYLQKTVTAALIISCVWTILYGLIYGDEILFCLAPVIFFTLTLWQKFNKKSIEIFVLNSTHHNFNIKSNKKLNRRGFSTSSRNLGNEMPDDEKKKKTSSWRQFFFLRLMVILGLLIFLMFSYALSQSFNISKVYNQIILFINDENLWNNILRVIRKCWLTYINIWSFKQWALSVGAIVPAYWLLFYILFRVGLIDRNFTAKEKIFFISTDLLLNFIVGLAYMAHPDTFIGALMHECPVALSPYFIVVEIIAFLLYQAWLKYKVKNKK